MTSEEMLKPIAIPPTEPTMAHTMAKVYCQINSANSYWDKRNKSQYTPSGPTESGGDRIINGYDVSIRDHPWAVYLLVEDEGGLKFKCAGSIVSKNLVVTAKHCVIGMVGGEGFYGAANLDEGEKFSFKTDSVTHHPMQYVDVALIQV
ncbi:hypodermin-A-like [Symsagittifera roscoffensis]|uniref:hypodermin-A-like n=1 Tax=Symsagittifera roscoffensis TaxID=84072 RepID=UPI00307BBC2F